MKTRVSKSQIVIAMVFAVIIVAIFALNINFLVGRYSSARTMMMLSMILFGGLFVRINLPNAPVSSSEMVRLREHNMLTLGAFATIAVILAGNIAFSLQWASIRERMETFVRSGSALTGVQIVSVGSIPETDADVAAALDQWGRGTSWTWPFASLLLAENYAPQRVIVDDTILSRTCKGNLFVPKLASTRVAPALLAELHRHACAQPEKPPHKGVLHKLKSLF